jgi:hypothetical protein
MEKLFTVAGTSRRNGVVKFRFSNDMKGRIPMLIRTGHTEIDLRELPEPMTKAAAIAYLESLDTPAETAATVRESLEADAIDTSTMTDDFLADVAAREMESEGAPAL